MHRIALPSLLGRSFQLSQNNFTGLDLLIESGDRNLRIVNWFLTVPLKDVPFQSEPLDNLAEKMQVTKILKINKSERYYKVRFLPAGAVATLGRVLIDSTYLEILLPEELLAVGAHEFTHLNRRHGVKRFLRQLVPAIVIGAIIGLVVSSLLVGVFSALGAYLASFYVNAKWLRQQETDCDLSSVKFLNSDAMAFALTKLDRLGPNKLESRIIPKLYPTIEQRIADIRKAMDDKKNQFL